MRIHELSDIHLEFGPYTPAMPQSDVLILAGDIFTSRMLLPRDKKLLDFIEAAKASTSHILFVPGNHEYYGGEMESTDEDMRGLCEEFGIAYMNDIDRYIVNDVQFIGRTLWTDYCGRNENAAHEARRRMRDYRQISVGKRRLDPEDLLAIHDMNVQDLQMLIDSAVAPAVVVFSHHAPSKKSAHPRYPNDYSINGCYSTDLEYLMGDRVKLWFHGHTHESFDYMVGSTRVVSNPRGYVNYEETRAFNPELIIEI